MPAAHRPGGRALRIGVAAVAMVLVAEAAAWALGPRDAVEPAPVSESDYFSEEELERARDYRAGQRSLFALGLATQAVALAAIALGRPRVARRLLERLGRRRVAGAAAAGAGLSLALAVVALPTEAWAHERAVDVGLSTQSLSAWLADVGKAALIGAALAAGGAALLIAMVGRFRRSWWLPGSVAVVVLAAAFTWLAPIVLAPIFNRFEPLPSDSRARADVLDLSRRTGVDVGEVYRVDSSRRSTAINAYVGGLGPTKRVVLYDTLIEEADPGELRSVVAHELAHVAHDDILRGLAFVAIVAPFGLLFTRELGEAVAARGGADPRSPAALPAWVLALGVAAFVLSVPGNALSRQVEASADTFALEATGEPRALIDLQLRLAHTNVSDPDPPDAVTLLLGTHPPTVERIGAALAWERGERP